MSKYNPQQIEKRWQKFWQQKKLFFAKDFAKKGKKYILVEFPYPSGAGLHMGHLRPYVAADAYARFFRMQGKEVLFPIGWDAFGLPAENYAIKMGVHPSITTKKNVANAKKQMLSWGLSFDWNREINTTDPDYYKWTQWLFLQFYKAGLAYESTGLINWCPKDKTGLANEEVIDGKCERCGTVVEKKELRQWYLKITQYAEKLLEGLKHLPQWPEAVKLQQENWIGKSVGAEITFGIAQKNVKRFVLLHGRGSSPKEAFFPWLKKNLELRGFEVQVPYMPGGEEPNDIEQANFVINNCTLDESTVILGHSFGGLVALRILEQGYKVQKIILAATPFLGRFSDGKARKSVVEAIQRGFNFKTIRANAKEIVSVSDEQDNIVPIKDGELLAQNLNGNWFKLKSEEPHFQGHEEAVLLNACMPGLKVFTTRPDTIFGATYMVVAPEHEIIKSLESKIENIGEVKKYIEKAKNKSEIDRTAEGKEKTGVELKGIRAINPATQEEIPVWVADYVLGHYGTGAIMAVPAHDERDFAFAKKFNLPIRQVIAPVRTAQEGNLKFHANESVIGRTAIKAIVKHWQENKYLVMKWQDGHFAFVSGGLEPGELMSQAVLREIKEETGFTEAVIKRELSTVQANFYSPNKNENRSDRQTGFYVELKNGKQDSVSVKEKALHTVHWLNEAEVQQAIAWGLVDPIIWAEVTGKTTAFSEPGIVINSAEFSGMKSDEALEKMGAKYGRLTAQYKLRDWVFSRQRYWGEPIPIVHCEKCGVVPVPEKDLPVKLPNVKKYEPTGTGQSPLAAIDKWVNTKCPTCKGPAKRETNTMPQWAGSSWYWLRYCDAKNKKAFSDKKKLAYWTPVNVYFGGMEHTTLHLLYSRFWNLFLYDQKLVTAKEPYTLRKPHGIVLGPDGEKMSKSRGNVVDPQTVVKSYGADTLRMYEMFLGPHEAMVAWSDKGIIGVKRFLDRVWEWGNRLKIEDSRFKKIKDSEKAEREINKLTKKITEDIENFRFNTCISAFMEFHNQVKDEAVSIQTVQAFLKLLYPFAPHIAEELNANLGFKKSLVTESWPTYNAAKIQESTVEIVIQVNGKVKGKLSLPANCLEDAVKEKALELESIKSLLAGESIKRVIYVPGRLMNLVI